MGRSQVGYEALAKGVVGRARRRGASEAEAFVQVGRESSVRVRGGEIEDLTQSTAKGLGLRVIVKRRLGFAYTSDFNAAGLDGFVDRAIALAESSAPNALNGLPERADFAPSSSVGALFDEEVASLAPEWKVKTAIEMEKLVKAFDPRITTTDGIGAGESVGEVYLANSFGVEGGWQDTSVYLFASPVATEGGQLQLGSWFDGKRFLRDLASPEEVATRAAQRAVQLLGAKKMRSQRVPVVFDPVTAAGFVSGIADAASGDAVHKKASFLAGHLGERLAQPWVTIVDDGVLPRGLGSSPFDGEGVPTRRTPIVKGGILSAFLYDSYTARKARAKTTGNASRSYSSLPHIGTNNLYLEAGTRSPEDIIAEVRNGLYVTSMLGHGGNLVTGEYSQGAVGLWIEYGELASPVQEITVGGNLLAMLSDIDAVGSDLTFRGTVGAPTIRFKELTVSGE